MCGKEIRDGGYCIGLSGRKTNRIKCAQCHEDYVRRKLRDDDAGYGISLHPALISLNGMLVSVASTDAVLRGKLSDDEWYHDGPVK